MNIIGAVESSIDYNIVILLLLLGFGIKKLKAFEKVDNKLIPAVLAIVGVLLAFVLHYPWNDINEFVNTFISGVVSAISAVGIHSSGKNITSYIYGILFGDMMGPITDNSDESSSDENSVG